jgi:hypothetical protein
MAKDDRAILEILQEELDFIEKRGYGRSVRTPWLPKSIFQRQARGLEPGFRKEDGGSGQKPRAGR